MAGHASIGNGFSSADGASWLCRSTDFGSTWEIRNTEDYSKWQGWFAHDVVVSPDDPNYLVVIGIEVWVSDDGGQTIYLESEGGVGYSNPPIEGPDGNENYVHSDCHDVIFHPTEPNVVLVASGTFDRLMSQRGRRTKASPRDTRGARFALRGFAGNIEVT